MWSNLWQNVLKNAIFRQNKMLCRLTIPSFFRAETWNTHKYIFFGLTFQIDMSWQTVLTLIRLLLEAFFSNFRIISAIFQMSEYLDCLGYHCNTHGTTVKIRKIRTSETIAVIILKFGFTIRDPTWQNQQNGCASSEDWSAWISAQSDQSLLSAWRKLGSLATHWMQSEDSDQTGQMPRLIWVFAGSTFILLVFSCRGAYSYRMADWSLVRPLLWEQSHPGLHCFPRPICH